MQLTRREREVLTLASEGLTNTEIAQLLYVEAHTVRFHLNALYKKNGCKNRVAAIRKAYEEGALPIPTAKNQS